MREDDLMERRSFGRACLADVRRRLTLFALDALAVPEGDPMRATSFDEHPAMTAVWEAPPQPRPLSEVLEEILELLARGDQFRAHAGGRRWSRSTRFPLGLNFERGTLVEVADYVFGCLKPREREILEIRFSRAETEAPSLADVGRTMGLTRERVRQIIESAVSRLSDDAERQRRRPLADFMAGTFQSHGGVLREDDVCGVLRKRYSGPSAPAYPVARALLEASGVFERVRTCIWCAVPVRGEDVRLTLLRLRLVVRKGARLMGVKQVAAIYQREHGESAPAGYLAGCLRADEGFRQFDDGRVGLREWEWGIPGTIEETLAACLRVHGTSQSVARLTERANDLLPPDRSVSAREVGAALAGSDRFTRIRPGTYALQERIAGAR